MASFAKGISYVMAAQFQAVTLIVAAVYVGDWLNENHPMKMSWYVVTFPVAILAVAQTFYVVIRYALGRKGTGNGADKPGSG